MCIRDSVTPNHLDHHKDMQEYIDAKRNILLYQKQPCRAVLGYEMCIRDRILSMMFVQLSKMQIRPFRFLLHFMD